MELYWHFTCINIMTVLLIVLSTLFMHYCHAITSFLHSDSYNTYTVTFCVCVVIACKHRHACTYNSSITVCYSGTHFH